MANDLVVVDDRPAWLAEYVPQTNNEEFVVPGGLPIGIISIKGKVWTAKYAGDETVLEDANGMAVTYFDGVILAANKATTKTLYLGDYEEGSIAKPDCASTDGIKPDLGVPARQASLCAQCPHNVWGSAKQGKGKRCQDNKRLATVPNGDIENLEFGGPMLMRLPPTSFRPFGEYIKALDAADKPLYAGITRMYFDPQSASPRILFKWVRWLTSEEFLVAKAHRDGEHIDRVLSVEEATSYQEEEEEREEDRAARDALGLAPATAQQPAPAAQAERKAAVAAATTAAKATTAPAAASNVSPLKRPAATKAPTTPPPPAQPVPDAAAIAAQKAAAEKAAKRAAALKALAELDADEVAAPVETAPVDAASTGDPSMDEILSVLDEDAAALG